VKGNGRGRRGWENVYTSDMRGVLLCLAKRGFFGFTNVLINGCLE